MQELNSYGNASGGYLFDQMDRYAHKYAIEEIGDCVTATSTIYYYNPLKLGDNYSMYRYPDTISTSKYSIFVTMKSGEKTIATASFLFIKRK